MRQVMLAAVGASVVASVAATVLIHGMLFSVTPASSQSATLGQPEAIIQGDVDCDGVVNPVDALKSLRYDAGLPVTQNDPCPGIGTVAAIPGPQGPAGPPGPPGISEYEIVLVESDNNSDPQKAVTADCSPGKSIMGGGARIVGLGGPINHVNIIESRPVGANWRATATEIDGGTSTDWWLEVRAICAKLGQ